MCRTHDPYSAALQISFCNWHTEPSTITEQVCHVRSCPVTRDLTYQQDEPIILPFKGHTCSFRLAVPVNAASLVLINEPIPDDDAATNFDVWLHESILGCQEFNAL
jgi:hypothetical protein